MLVLVYARIDDPDGRISGDQSCDCGALPIAGKHEPGHVAGFMREVYGEGGFVQSSLWSTSPCGRESGLSALVYAEDHQSDA